MREQERGARNRRVESKFLTSFFDLLYFFFSTSTRKKKKTQLISSLSPPNQKIRKQEPIITWSFIIGGIGLAIPLVVPPVRDAVTPASRKQPPSVAQLLGREGAGAGAAAAVATAGGQK